MATPQCALCDSALPAAAEQQLLKPVSEANADVHEFLVTFVKPDCRFGTEAAYTCRRTCFANLTKSVRHNIALRELLCTLEAPVMLALQMSCDNHVTNLIPAI